MLIGDKKRFAIEMKFDEFYDDNFIASGSFRMYVNNFAYGYEGSHSTTFYMIAVGLKKLMEENVIVPNIFKSYTDYEIASTYQMVTFEGDDLLSDNYLGISKESFRTSFFDFRWYTEQAFDDCSFMLMFRDERNVKLIGFQMPVETHTIENVKSIEIPRNEFDDVIRESYNKLMEAKELNNKIK